MVSGSAWRRPRLALLVASGALAAAGCGKSDGTAERGAPAAALSASTTPAGDATRRAALVSAEQRRASRDVLDADLSQRDVAVRRAAARALARIADARSSELLAKSVADEDEEVVIWSAYGLGYACREREARTVKALAARAASLLVARNATETAAPEPGDAGTRDAKPVLVSPLSAIAGALGRCGGAEAERTLRAWVRAEGFLAADASLALGTIASRSGRLDDATLVALLDAASRPKEPVPNALYPFSRLSGLGEPVAARLLDVARARLGTTGIGRGLAISALTAGGDAAANELARIAGSPGFDDTERAAAVRALGHLALAGQKALEDALETLLADASATSEAALATSRFGVLTALLDALAPPLGKSAPLLARLTELPDAAPPAARRRVVALRCRAAALLAGRGTLSPKLLACDPDPNGRAGRLAFLRVLDRGPLRGARFQRFNELLHANDAAVRERALELLATHAEAPGIPALLAEALASKAPGDVAAASALIARYPVRAASPDEKPRFGESSDAGAPGDAREVAAAAPSPAIVRALTKALDDWSKADDIEVRASLADAAGALELLGAKDRLEKDCKSGSPELRQHAEKALARLGLRDRHCDTFDPDYAPPAELARKLAAPQKLVFETDAGTFELVLDPKLAPVATTRLTELARAGFFDGVAVHRVVPGFVVQFGDPGGDGYGGAKVPPLRCETSPAAFTAGSVGIALGGRDTGSSQFFVTLARHPQLDGEYALVGHAGDGWDRIAEGDVVRKVRVGD